MFRTDLRLPSKVLIAWTPWQGRGSSYAGELLGVPRLELLAEKKGTSLRKLRTQANPGGQMGVAFQRQQVAVRCLHQCELLTNINVSHDVNLQNQVSNQWLLLFLVISSDVMLGKGTMPIS